MARIGVVHPLRDLLDHQSGVVARRQLLGLGYGDNDIRREVRNRRLAVVHRGVFVNHTGPLTWVNRAWAAVLHYQGSALCGPSALTLSGHPIHVAIGHARHAAQLDGIVVHRMRDLEGKVQWNRSPPRLRVEEAVLDVAGAARTTAAAVAVVSEACSRRATTPERLLEALDRRQRTPRGAELRRILADAALGTRSVLERDFCCASNVLTVSPGGPGRHVRPRRPAPASTGTCCTRLSRWRWSSTDEPGTRPHWIATVT